LLAIYVVFFGAGINFGANPSLLSEVVSAKTQVSISGGLIYLVICISMTILGLALLLATPAGIIIDIFKRDSLVIQATEPLLSGFAFGIAYQSIIQLLSVVLTLSAISK
jgi:hypothetical protein